MDVGRVGAKARVDNPTEEVIPTEEDRMDGPMDVGVDTALIRDADNSNAATTPTDGGDAVELMRVQEHTSASTEVHGNYVHMSTECATQAAGHKYNDNFANM